MSIPININDVIQATVEGVNERQPWAWVSHYKVTGITNPDAWRTALADFLVAFLDQLKTLLTTEWQAECTKISRVAPAPMGVFFHNDDMPVVGTVATDGIPNQSAAIVRMYTDEPGANNRGRMFLCGIPEASTNGGQLLATPKGAIETTFTSYFIPGVSASGNTGVPVIFSRALYGTDPPGHPAAVDDYTAIITSAEPQYNLGVIRNRRYPLNAAG